MKKGEVPELSSKWWKTSQPKGLTSATKLEVALRAHEAAVAGLKKDPKADKLSFALETLDAVKDAVQKAVAEAGRAKGNAEMEFTVQALKKIDFAKEAKQIESGAGPIENEDDDEEEDASSVADPKAFAKVLRKSLNRVGGDPWNWGFLAGKKPIEHRLFMHRSKNGRALAVAAAKELGRAPKLSFGTAIRSPDEETTLILTVEGAMLAGLATRAKKMLAKMKPQPITEILLMVDGKIVPELLDPNDVDLDDDDDAATAGTPDLEGLRRRLAALAPRITAVVAAMPAYRDRLAASVQQVMAAIEKQDAAGAGSTLDKLEEVINRLEGATTPAAAAAPAGAALTSNLLATLSRAMPESMEQLPSVLSGMIPRFLLAIQNEPNLDATPLRAGATVPAADQILTVADSLNAVLRSARRWEMLLGQAETGNVSIDKMEAADRDEAAQQQYEELVTSYNSTRTEALAEEERCMQLMNALMTEFRATQAASA